jgi:hypothetical protein
VNFGKTQGLFSKNARLRLKGWIWSTESRSDGGDLNISVWPGLGLTGRLGAVGAVGWPSDGHGAAQAASGGARRRRSAGERLRKRHTALGCTDCCELFTRTSSGARQALRWPPGAASGTLDGGRRGDVAAELRWGRAGGAEHYGASGRRQNVPYLAAKARRRRLCDGRRRELGFTAVARTETAVARSFRVWRWRQQELGF